MLSKCYDVVHNGCCFLSGEGQNIVYIYLYEYTNTGSGMQVGISRNQLSSIVRTNGCAIKVGTKKDEHNVSKYFVCSVEQNERGGEVIECKEIVVEGKEINNQVQGKIRNSGRG